MSGGAREILAIARGARLDWLRDDECLCAMCGGTLFASAGPAKRVLGSNFVNYELLEAPGEPDVCVGCETLLSGRPGDTPPPLRTASLVATGGEHCALEQGRVTILWPVLRSPPSGSFVASWAIGGQIHHWLRAGVSTADRMEIGSDKGAITYVPSDDDRLLSAVEALLWAPTGTGPLLSRTSIISGDYSPTAVTKFGVASWQRLESVVQAYRPSLLLELVAACAPTSVRSAEEAKQVIDPVDLEAASLLAAIARASDMRTQDGLAFWGGVYRHRLERARRDPLPSLVSKLLDSCRCHALHPGSLAAVEAVQGMSEDQIAAVQRSIRDRPALLLVLALQIVKEGRALATPSAQTGQES